MKLLFAVVIPIAGLFAFESHAQKLEYKKPNIIFIMADDLGYGDLGCYGQQKIQTPNIDRLAEEGLRFTQAYAGGPVCTPSRCVLMTGLHNGHTAARDNIPHYPSYLNSEDITTAEVLKKAGYRCGGVGKWSLGDSGTIGSATNQGFDMWFGYLNQDHAHYYYPEYLDDNYRIENHQRYELPGNEQSREFYSHNLLTDRALQFIRDSYEVPFFLYTAFTLPHFSAPEEDKDGLTVPTTDPYSHMEWNEKSKKYASMVNMLDRDVGRIVELVDKLGLRDNTLIIFTSDNGGHDNIWKGFDTNGPFRGYKRDLTEGGIRVPFIARWPGKVPAGSVSNEVIAFQDMMPTFAELAKQTAPQNIDGISVVKALLGKDQEEKHPYLYWDYGHCRKRYDQAVRMENWKGIRYGQGGEIELYDLESDLAEAHNVAEKFPEVVLEIEEIMKSAFIPNDRYPVGELYKGGPIWTK
jgi:arylsulfatase A-like enzyme